MIVDAVAALDHGDASPLRRLLARDTVLDERGWLAAWYAISTLAGRVVGRLTIEQDGRRHDALLAEHPPHVLGGGPRVVLDTASLARELQAALAAPGVESHRRAALQTLARLREGRLAAWECDPAAALLRHHTDLPVGVPPRAPLVPGDALTMQREATTLAPLSELLAGRRVFAAHLRAGLSARSEARRRLAGRLLAL